MRSPCGFDSHNAYVLGFFRSPLRLHRFSATIKMGGTQASGAVIDRYNFLMQDSGLKIQYRQQALVIVLGAGLLDLSLGLV